MSLAYQHSKVFSFFKVTWFPTQWIALWIPCIAECQTKDPQYWKQSSRVYAKWGTICLITLLLLPYLTSYSVKYPGWRAISGKILPYLQGDARCSDDSSGRDVSEQDNEEMLLQGPCPGGVQVGTVGAGFQQDQLSHGADPACAKPS